MKKLSIGVAGCGVAGLACAVALARAGHRVVLFDRLDKPAPVGSGIILQPVGLAVLAALGLATPMSELGAPISRLFGKASPSGRTVLDVRYAALADDVEGLGVHRGALFRLLYEAALAAGATVEPRSDITAVEPLAAGRAAFIRNGAQTASFDLALDALGARSPLSGAPFRPLKYGALWANLTWEPGFDPHALEQRYWRAKKMVGVMPIGRVDFHSPKQAALFWSLRHDDFSAWRAGPLAAWKDEVRTLWPATAPLLTQIDSHDDLVFARYAHRTLRTPLGRGFVHVGDSWRCTSPQLGQGANMALLDALALATALAAHADRDEALAAYARARIWHVRLYQTASWLFTPVYQSDGTVGPWLRDWIASPLSRIWPAPELLAALVAGRLGAPLRAIGGKPDARSATDASVVR